MFLLAFARRTSLHVCAQLCSPAHAAKILESAHRKVLRYLFAQEMAKTSYDCIGVTQLIMFVDS